MPCGFYNCLKECGIEQTNKINKAAIRDMSAIEIKRIKKAAGCWAAEHTLMNLKSFLSL